MSNKEYKDYRTQERYLVSHANQRAREELQQIIFIGVGLLVAFLV